MLGFIFCGNGTRKNVPKWLCESPHPTCKNPLGQTKDKMGICKNSRASKVKAYEHIILAVFNTEGHLSWTVLRAAAGAVTDPGC